MSSSRLGLRFFSQASRSTSIRSALRNRQILSKRYQTTEAAPVAQQSLLNRLWTSEVGIKTVHFWAPVMKWAIVLAGVSDMLKPAEKLSLNTNAALMATGSIWTRWCFVIRPKNILLAAVNACLATVGAIQVGRILSYQRSQAGSTEAVVKELEQGAKDTLKKTEQQVQKAVQ